MHSKAPFLATGAVGGFLVGYLTRPTFMGVKLPLEVLWSGHKVDAAFRSELMSHLAITIGVGLAAAWLIHMFVAGKEGGSDKSAVSGADLAKWHALVDVDPEIAKAAATARSKDPECERVLMQKYLHLNDKAYLNMALRQALDDHAARAKRQDAMAAIEIRWSPVKRFQGLEFRRGVAVSQHGESNFLVQGGLWSIDEGPLAGTTYSNERDMRAALAGEGIANS